MKRLAPAAALPTFVQHGHDTVDNQTRSVGSCYFRNIATPKHDTNKANPRPPRAAPSHPREQDPSMTRVYLDYNATTPVEPAVMQALLPYLGPQFGNASSSYMLGQTAKKAVAVARAQVASMLGASDPNEIVFVSGGTESINHAIKGSALAAKRTSGRSHIVTSRVEHVAVLETCKWLETQGFQVTYLPVDGFGCVRVQDVVDALTVQTCLVSIMLANNEVGSLQPVAEISRAVRRFVEQDNRLPIIMHTDASQAIGKVRVNVVDLGVQLLTVAGHKIYAPKGVGALYIRESTILDTIIHGASQEHGRRGGTENVALVAALGQACALVEKNLHEYAVVMQESRAFLLEQIQKHCSLTNVSYQVNGHPELSLPNTLSISFENIGASRLLDLMEADGVYASAGSACHGHKQDRSTENEKNSEHQGEHTIAISHVLAAMHVPPEFAKGTLRLSVGRSTAQEEVLHAANAIHKAIQHLS